MARGTGATGGTLRQRRPTPSQIDRVVQYLCPDDLRPITPPGGPPRWWLYVCADGSGPDAPQWLTTRKWGTELWRRPYHSLQAIRDAIRILAKEQRTLGKSADQGVHVPKGVIRLDLL